MVFEPNFTKVLSSVRNNIGITQSVIELKLPTNEDVIDAIYSVGARSTIVTSEVSGNEINFTGLVDFQAMYESQGVSAVDYTAEFRDKFTSDKELNDEIVLSSNIVDVTSNIVSNGIRVVAIVETTIDQIVSRDISVLTGVCGDNIYLSTKEIEVSSYLGKASEKFDVSHDFEIKDASKVLIVTPSACIHKVEPKENYLTVSGVLNIDICYQVGDSVSDIKNENRSIDFSWEVALNGIDENSSVQSEISIISNEIKVSTMLEENSTTINMYIPLMYNGYVFNKKILEVVDDVYSQCNYLSVTNENFDTLNSQGSIGFRDAISGTASISDTAPFIDEILGVCTNNIVLASSRVMSNKLCIEGVANATVVYYTKETGCITSVQVEMPFSVEQKVEGEQSNVVTLCLVDVNARSKRGKEIEVSAELNVYSDMYEIKGNCVITDVTVGEEKQKDDCSLYIYIVKPNDTIWSIAKEMNVSQDTILEQNPDVELPLRVGERLVIYKPQMFDF